MSIGFAIDGVMFLPPRPTEQSKHFVGSFLEGGGFLSMGCWSHLVKIFARRSLLGAVFVFWVNIVPKMVFYINGNENFEIFRMNFVLLKLNYLNGSTWT